MKIAVPFEDGQVFQHFGRSAQFKFYEAENGQLLRTEVIPTNGQGHGALAGFLVQHGADVVLCGGIGAGNTTKLANQIIVAANIQAVAEALTLAQKAGVDPDLVFQAIKGGLAGSTVMNAKAPMMIEGNDKPGFKVDLHIKDLNNALDCAHTVGAPVPMTAEVQEILQWLHSNGKGQADHSAIAQYYEHLTGIKLGRDL